jgi:hypothetical protein
MRDDRQGHRQRGRLTLSAVEWQMAHEEAFLIGNLAVLHLS